MENLCILKKSIRFAKFGQGILSLCVLHLSQMRNWKLFLSYYCKSIPCFLKLHNLSIENALAFWQSVIINFSVAHKIILLYNLSLIDTNLCSEFCAISIVLSQNSERTLVSINGVY